MKSVVPLKGSSSSVAQWFGAVGCSFGKSFVGSYRIWDTPQSNSNTSRSSISFGFEGILLHHNTARLFSTLQTGQNRPQSGFQFSELLLLSLGSIQRQRCHWVGPNQETLKDAKIFLVPVSGMLWSPS